MPLYGIRASGNLRCIMLNSKRRSICGRCMRFFIAIAILTFLIPPSLSAQINNDTALEECCRKAFEGCKGSGEDKYGRWVLEWGCAITDYYGRISTQEGASEELKAAQKCMDQACPYAPNQPKKPPQKEEEERLPIIFLPGVAGSILEARDRELWPLAPFGDRADLAMEPDGKTSSTKANVVVGDVLRGRPGMDYYGSFIDSLKSMGYVENQDLFVFSYDWRQDNASHYDRLDQMIDTALSKTGKKKVILTAHSMGGVIARGYVYSRSDRAAKVDSFITMATPYWGAPKVYYAMINGYQFGNDSVRQELMKILMQNYPAGYQLLPQAPFITDTASGNILSLDESNKIRYKWFTNVWYSIKDVYTPTEGNERFLNPGLLNQSREFWSSVGTKDRATPLPAGVKQYAIIGYGVSTLGGYKLEEWESGLFAGSYLEIGDKKVVLHPVSTDGDGTVPLWSLQTSAASASYFIPYKSELLSKESSSHAELPANRTVQSLVSQIVKHENGSDESLPDPNQFPKPRDYMGIPLKAPNIEEESLGTFELHSDAHLRISTEGRTLGYNSSGGIEETLPGTFLSMDGVEYVSIADLNIPLKVTVTGIRDGKFTLDVGVKSDGKMLSSFSYKEVPVQKGTVAEVTMTLAQTSTPPAIKVMTGGKTTSIAANANPKRPGGFPGLGTRPGWEERELNTAYNGTNLTYYPQPDIDKCQSDCAGNDKCQGFTWIAPGTYNPGDSAMCYLVAVVTGRSTAKGHTSAVKSAP